MIGIKVKRLGAFGMSGLMMAAAALVAAPAAQAAEMGTSTSYTSYSQTRVFKSKPLDACFRVTLSGEVRKTTKAGSVPRASRVTTFHLRNPRLTQRAVSCRTGRAKTINKWTIQQSWWDRGCTLNPSVGASFPWGVSVSITPDCGKRKTAQRKQSYGKAKLVQQNNSGYPVNLGKVSSRAPVSRCFSASTQTTAWGKSWQSDTFRITGFKVCA